MSDRPPRRSWRVTPYNVHVCEGVGVVFELAGRWYAEPWDGSGRLGPFATLEEARAALERRRNGD
ncbi:MAG TPA: hypothetical protein VKN99_02520 [Polyangia bacterium]|nr:hypothetical protein [Polyangia bacterium]